MELFPAKCSSSATARAAQLFQRAEAIPQTKDVPGARFHTAAGSGTLLGRGVSPAPPRCCVLSPWQPHCPHLPSAEGTLLQGCSRLGVILSCSGWINQEGFFFCTFCFSSAAMKRTNAEPPAWSCLRCWRGENSKGCFVWCLSG